MVLMNPDVKGGRGGGCGMGVGVEGEGGTFLQKTNSQQFAIVPKCHTSELPISLQNKWSFNLLHRMIVLP